MELTKDTRFLIIGLGLIGGCYARGLAKHGYHVAAVDQNPESIRYALAEGMIEKGSEIPTPELLGRCDAAVLGLYPAQMAGWIRQYQHLFRPGTLLTDVCGVKSGVVDAVQEALRPDLEFIGCHPMAGRELSGVQNSDERIFEGANFLITPTGRNTPEAIAFARELGRVLGFGRITELDPGQHDELIGFVSQLTHAIAVSLMTCNEDPNLQFVTGDSFRDLTRIARINEELWSELFFSNRERLLREIDSFAGQLGRLRRAVAEGDQEGLREMFRKSTRRRAEFDRPAPEENA